MIQHSVAAVILSFGGIVAIASYFWSTTKQVFSGMSFFLLLPVEFPTWLILPIILVALIPPTLLLIASRTARHDRDVTSEPVNNYTEDSFEGLKWRWQWYGNTPSQFIPYCPVCDCALTQTFSGIKHYGQKLHFDCPNCHFSKVISMESELLETRIIQLIDYRLRKKD